MPNPSLNDILAKMKAEFGTAEPLPSTSTMELPVIRQLPPLSLADQERRDRIFEEHACGLDG